jgi:hypothetical protein
LSTEHFADLPSAAAMIILIVALLLLQRRNPRIAMGSWLVALGLIFLSKLSWYVTWFNTPYYAAVHTFRLTVDLLVGMVLLLFTGRRLSRLSLRLPVLLWIGAPFIVVEILYGMEVAQPGPYCVCAAAGAVISVGVAAKLRRGVATAVAQVMVWLAIAGFSVSGNFRASAYVGLAAVYAAAAVHVSDSPLDACGTALPGLQRRGLEHAEVFHQHCHADFSAGRGDPAEYEACPA